MEPQPELWIESNHPHAPWKNITLWCRSPSRVSSKFLLTKDNTQMTWIRPSFKTFQVSFFIGALSEATTGLYRCSYWKEKGWSKPSRILELEAPGEMAKLDTQDNFPTLGTQNCHPREGFVEVPSNSCVYSTDSTKCLLGVRQCTERMQL